MRVVIQRVARAAVEVEKKIVSKIDKGLLVLLGIEQIDNLEEVKWMCGKIARLRIFGDDKGHMNLSVRDVGGEILIVSQFTLHASTKKGNRPSFIKAASPDLAIPLYESFIEELTIASGCRVVSGIFGADMKVSLLNDGPVTIIIDSINKE